MKEAGGLAKQGAYDLLPTISLVAPFETPRPGMLKIGTTARNLGISVQVIRLYEAEGLIISFKSKGGTRWYSKEDRQWISKIRELLSYGLNFEGIRWLLAQIPCWSLRPCTAELHAGCSMRTEYRMPCWIAPEKLCSEKLKECYHGAAYRSARDYVHLKTHAEIVPFKTDS